MREAIASMPEQSLSETPIKTTTHLSEAYSLENTPSRQERLDYVLANTDEIVIFANRTIEPQKAGGLVQAITAFSNKFKNVSITSIGWNGKTTPMHEIEQEGPQEVLGLLRPNGPINVSEVPLSENEVHDYYEDMANNWLWFAFHDMSKYTEGEFKTDNWESYKRVNERFADNYIIYANNNPGKRRILWTHDYHLTLNAKYLREKDVDSPLGFFLHIPFPPPEAFKHMPQASHVESAQSPVQEIIDGMLANDIVGFQTKNDAQNFVKSAKTYLGLRDEDVSLIDNGYMIKWQGRDVTVKAYPISIDSGAIEERITTPSAMEKRKKMKGIFKDKTVLIDVSRLDPTKGIEAELMAYDKVLKRLQKEDTPQSRKMLEELKFIRIVSPSRLGVPAYRELNERIRELVDRVNSKYMQYGKKIMYVDRDVKNETVLAMLAESDVAVIATEKDGMNLVAKEAIAAGKDDAAIIIGQGAGASQELKGNIISPLVGDDDRLVEHLADSIYYSLKMKREKKMLRMERAKKHVREHGIEEWGGDNVSDFYSYIKKAA